MKESEPNKQHLANFGRTFTLLFNRGFMYSATHPFQIEAIDSAFQTLDRLLAFLGLEPGFRPAALGKVEHAGGNSNRIPHGLRVWLRERAFVRYIWNAIPDSRRGRLRFLYERWNGAGHHQETSPGLTPELQKALVLHFAADLKGLVVSGLTAPPWANRYLAD